MCELDLRRFIEINKRLDLETAKRIMLQVVDAVIYLHQSRIFHRDLKPDNILLKRFDDLTVKVSDFGLSTTEILSANEFPGTTQYKSPEIFNRKPGFYWAKNDVWAMGIIFFSLLNRAVPWVNPNER